MRRGELLNCFLFFGEKKNAKTMLVALSRVNQTVNVYVNTFEVPYLKVRAWMRGVV